MDALAFLKAYGTREAEAVVAAAGTNMNYFRQLCCGSRRPSVDLAQKLVHASQGRMGFTDLLLSKRRAAQTDPAQGAPA